MKENLEMGEEIQKQKKGNLEIEKEIQKYERKSRNRKEIQK